MSRQKDIAEGRIALAVQLGHKNKTAAYFVFDDSLFTCPDIDSGDLVIGRNGFSITYRRRAEFKILREEDPPQNVVLFEDGDCLIRLMVQKLVRRRETWVNAETEAAASVFESFGDQAVHPFEKIAKLVKGNDWAKLFFLTGDGEQCPTTVSVTQFWDNSLLIKDAVSHRSTLEGVVPGDMLPEKSSAYERRFSYAAKDCKYELAVRLFFKNDGIYTPIPARDLGPGDFE